MSNKIILKKSSVADEVPTANDLEYGELAINYTDEKLFYKNSSNQIVQFGGGSGINTIQEGFINSTDETGTGVVYTEDACYYDIDLTQSPYTPVDPDKSVPVFEGGMYYYNDTKVNGETMARVYSITTRILETGNTLRISASHSGACDYYLVGRWRIVEVN